MAHGRQGARVITAGMMAVLAAPWSALGQPSIDDTLAAFRQPEMLSRALEPDLVLRILAHVAEDTRTIADVPLGIIPIGVRRTRWPARGRAVVPSSSGERSWTSKMAEHHGWTIRVTPSSVSERWTAAVEVWPPDLRPQIHSAMIVPFVRSFETEAEALAAGTAAAKCWVAHRGDV